METQLYPLYLSSTAVFYQRQQQQVFIVMDSLWFYLVTLHRPAINVIVFKQLTSLYRKFNEKKKFKHHRYNFIYYRIFTNIINQNNLLSSGEGFNKKL